MRVKRWKTQAALTLILLLMSIAGTAQDRILVYTRNYTPDGKGYVHDNIAASVKAIQEMGGPLHVQVDTSDDPAVFTVENLKRYKALVFSNSNNEAFATDEQRAAFKGYIERGGGWVGIHSASGSERKWDWFAQMVGARFVAHPRKQTFVVHVEDPSFAAMKGLPPDFTVTDECYFTKQFSNDLHVVLTTDSKHLDLTGFTWNGSVLPNPVPLAWWQEFDGGREFYLGLGHDVSNYSDPLFLGIVRRAIQWAMHQPVD